LKEISLAILNYESTHKHFPTGAQANGFGWTTAILPYLEQEPVAEVVKKAEDFAPPAGRNHFTVTLPGIVPDDPFVALRDARIPQFLCPSPEAQKTQEQAEGNYFTLHYYGCMGAKGDGYEVAPNSQGGFANTGLLVPGVTVRITDVKDGASNTLLLVEISRDTAPGSETADWQGYRAWPRGTEGDMAFGTKNLAHGVNTTMYNGTDNFNDISPSSNHVGGVNAVMADGSVRFVPEKIDVRMLRGAATRRGKEGDIVLD
jgi:prepilin-type processing-associated H-X9-DG protein